MREDILTLSVVNFKPSWGNKEKNLNKIKGYAKVAARQGSQMVILPELALSGYDNEIDVEIPVRMHKRVAETIPGKATYEVSELAKELDIYVVFGMPEADPENLSITYNSVAICCPDGEVKVYRKIHLPLDESDWAIRGDSEMVFETKWGMMGLAICYDTYNFPELIRYARARGARIFINPTAVCKAAAPYPLVRTLIESNVLRDTMYMASANLCGFDKYNYFIGCSSIIGPDNNEGSAFYFAGYKFYEEKSDQAEIFTANIDLSLAEQNTMLCMYTHNKRTATPDFRPDI